jgi:hypothetical protein
MGARKPDYILRAAERLDGEKKGHWRRVGAAWVNESGTVSITLDPFVILDSRDHPSLILAVNDGEKES